MTGHLSASEAIHLSAQQGLGDQIDVIQKAELRKAIEEFAEKHGIVVEEDD